MKWVFMSSSGHELNFRGTNAYLKSNRIPAPKDVYLWTHLGADLITYDYAKNPDGTPSPELLEPMARLIKSALQQVVSGL